MLPGRTLRVRYKRLPKALRTPLGEEGVLVVLVFSFGIFMVPIAFLWYLIDHVKKISSRKLDFRPDL